jgi:hypothetical protein
MSSSYSSSLRIELIGSGDQAGTWGTTTDNNLAYLLDVGIAGYQTVSVTSASQALTYLNGATSSASLNQSVYAMLRFTTTVGATFAVYAPPVSKMYIIYNNSGYSATLYNSTVIGNTTAAGTGLTIPDGAKYVAFSDGTNFYKTDSGTGTVTSVGWTGGLVSVATQTTTPAFTVAGTSGGVPYFSSASTWASSAALTQYGVMYGGGAGSAPSSTAAGTAGYFLMSNGASAPTWASIVPSGTLMLFQQTSAPTGWTKQTTHNDKALRVVSGAASSGGSSSFTTVFTNQTPTITTSGLSAGATTLTTAQVPAHTHSVTVYTGCGYAATGAIQGSCGGGGSGNVNTSSAFTGGSHTHSISGSATSSAITLAVQYVDLIIASKD